MLRACQAASICTAFMFAAGAFAGDWVQFTNETSKRLVASPGIGINDTQEKDYAWGDVDRDGDIDLVVVRKQIGSTIGRRRNVLFVNEDGVLTDRTDDYATAADDGGQGFLDLTNDRDVALVDVDQEQQCLQQLESLGETAWSIGEVVARADGAAVIFV